MDQTDPVRIGKPSGECPRDPLYCIGLGQVAGQVLHPRLWAGATGQVQDLVAVGQKARSDGAPDAGAGTGDDQVIHASLHWA